MRGRRWQLLEVHVKKFYFLYPGRWRINCWCAEYRTEKVCQSICQIQYRMLSIWNILNSSRPSDVYMRQELRLSLVRIMAFVCSTSSYYLKHWWLICNRSIGAKFWWIMNQVTTLFFQESGNFKIYMQNAVRTVSAQHDLFSWLARFSA